MFSNSKNLPTILFIILISACGTLHGQNNIEKDYDKSFEVGAMEAFCEMVNYGVKKLGLGVPLVPEEMDRFLPYAEKTAKKHNVLIYRESDLIDTDLFKTGIAKGRDVLLIYKGTTLSQYLDLKADRKNLEEKNLYQGKVREDIARRFGRMLSYTPRTINNQLSLHTDFRTMYNFGISACNLTFYYKDLGKATKFYTQTLGLKLVEDNNSSKVIQLADDSFLTLVDAEIEQQLANEAKTVALALVTEQLEEWYKYLENQDVELKYQYKASEGKPHDGFVVVDPEGYLLEFERFNQHPENEVFIPHLKENKNLFTKIDGGEKLSIHSSITWFYYKNMLQMQNYYQDVLGLEMVCDQGWAKIYKSSKTGYIGLVDEKRGMHQFTEKKAVLISFILEDFEGWYQYAKQNNLLIDLDPEGYHMHFIAE